MTEPAAVWPQSDSAQAIWQAATATKAEPPPINGQTMTEPAAVWPQSDCVQAAWQVASAAKAELTPINGTTPTDGPTQSEASWHAAVAAQEAAFAAGAAETAGAHAVALIAALYASEQRVSATQRLAAGPRNVVFALLRALPHPRRGAGAPAPADAAASVGDAALASLRRLLERMGADLGRLEHLRSPDEEEVGPALEDLLYDSLDALSRYLAPERPSSGGGLPSPSHIQTPNRGALCAESPQCSTARRTSAGGTFSFGSTVSNRSLPSASVGDRTPTAAQRAHMGSAPPPEAEGAAGTSLRLPAQVSHLSSYLH